MFILRHTHKLLLSALFSASAFAVAPTGGQEKGNGGDAVALDFTQTAQQALSRMRMLPYLPHELKITDFERALETTQVIAVDTVTIPGPDGKAIELDAQNLPNANRPTIRVNRGRWQQKMQISTSKDLALKMGIVVHEYLGIMGLERNDYHVTSRLKLVMEGMSLKDEELAFRRYAAERQEFGNPGDWVFRARAARVILTRACMDLQRPDYLVDGTPVIAVCRVEVIGRENGAGEVNATFAGDAIIVGYDFETEFAEARERLKVAAQREETVLIENVEDPLAFTFPGNHLVRIK